MQFGACASFSRFDGVLAVGLYFTSSLTRFVPFVLTMVSRKREKQHVGDEHTPYIDEGKGGTLAPRVRSRKNEISNGTTGATR
eukprot:scaffold520_cov16-Tisochrysis_lutea.AAC.1